MIITQISSTPQAATPATTIPTWYASARMCPDCGERIHFGLRQIAGEPVAHRSQELLVDRLPDEPPAGIHALWYQPVVCTGCRALFAFYQASGRDALIRWTSETVPRGGQP